MIKSAFEDNKNKRTEQDKPATAKHAESLYNITELAAAASRFGVQKECVITAMKQAGKTTASFTEAEKIIKQFMAREVK